MPRSRPITALAGIGLLWIGARAAILYGDGGAPRPDAAPQAVTMESPIFLAVSHKETGWELLLPIDGAAPDGPYLPRRSRSWPSPGWTGSGTGQGKRMVTPQWVNGEAGSASAAPLSVSSSAWVAAHPTPGPPPPLDADRWRLSAWVFLRGRGAASSLSGQLGGSQAGVRGAWRVDRQGRTELFVRVTADPRGASLDEAAAGVALRPVARWPVQVALERRVAMARDRGRDAFAIYAVGGVSDAALTRDWRIDAYGAAGMVGGARRDLFAEGQLIARRPIMRIGPMTVDSGAGLWGAAQPGAARVDAGPGATLRWEQGRVHPRLSIDWRQRVAGGAAPGSALAVTLGADF